MPSESPKKCSSNEQLNSDRRQKHLSDVVVEAPDLNLSQSSSKNDDSQHSSTTTTTSNSQSSPVKSTPSKSRSKKKNDARKRNANLKKQAVTAALKATAGTPSKDNDNGLNNQEKNSEKTSQMEQLQSKITDQILINQQAQKQQKPMDPSPQNRNENISKSPPPATRNLQLQQTDETAGSIQKGSHDTNSWRRKQRENRELREQLKLRDAQLQTLTDRLKLQITKTKQLEASLVSTTRTCNQFEKLLTQELTIRTKLETENEGLNQIIVRLKSQLSAHEKNKTTNDELIRVLNATLMERETEVSILKLKMTRMQTNPANMALNSSMSSNKQDPQKNYAMSGRSNSEFCRNSYIRSTMMAEVASARSSTTQLQSNNRDASVWATVPEELTPSKRPLVLERNFQPIYDDGLTSSPISRDRRYKTLPKSMKSPLQETHPDRLAAAQKENNNLANQAALAKPANQCLITNLDDSNSTNQSEGNRTLDQANNTEDRGRVDASERSRTNSEPKTSRNITSAKDLTNPSNEINKDSPSVTDSSRYPSISMKNSAKPNESLNCSSGVLGGPSSLPDRSPSTPVKFSLGLKKIFGRFRRSDSSSESQSKTELRIDPPTTPTASAFQRGAARSTLLGPISNRMSPLHREFKTDKSFAEWDTDMLVDWLTMIGLSMYATQCRRWVKCGAHIMDATPAEVDKGLGITNHLHRKKLRLAISELNGDCDKITREAAKLDFLWVARWLDDIGLPQYKETFISARVDGRVLHYLTVEDLVSMGVKSLLHHSSIRNGIKVLRSINFDLQALKRRATADEVEQMSTMRQRMDDGEDQTNSLNSKEIHDQVNLSTEDVTLWTSHRVMEWLRMIDFAEFASNLRGSGVHGGLIMFEDGFNIDTMCTLLSIPTSRTLLRRHLSTYFEALIGRDLMQRKRQHGEISSNQSLNTLAEIKAPKKSPWFGKKGSRVGQDGMDEYLCPMYPVEPQLIKSPTRKTEAGHRETPSLPRIPESINV